MQTFSPTEWVKIDIASAYGKDKESWENRLKWFNSQENFDFLQNSAKEPIRFLQGLNTISTLKSGLPSGFTITLDASASGLQILSLLSGDIKGAIYTNLIPSSEPKDVYTILTNKLKLNIPRDQVKKAIMTAFYSSRSQPRKVFKSRVNAFYELMNTELPAAWQLNRFLEYLWDPKVKHYYWTLPDNYEVKTTVYGINTYKVTFLNRDYYIDLKEPTPQESGRSLGPNVVHSIDGFIVRELTRRAALSRQNALNIKLNSKPSHENYKMVEKLWTHFLNTKILSARIFDFLDKHTLKIINPNQLEKLINTLPNKPFQVMSIHDCFRCLPSYVNEMRRLYNQIMYEISQSTLLSSIVAELTHDPTASVTRANNFTSNILKADYAIS